MPMAKSYSNGTKNSMPSRGNPNPPPRGVIGGWSRAAVRRHTEFLYSVETDLLSGTGIAYTLTLRDLPASAAEFQKMRIAWERKVKAYGSTRIHWVVEWQRRGVPHIHAAVYFDRELDDDDAAIPLLWWCSVVERAGYYASWRSQWWDRIAGPVGWLKYLSKHAARGVDHYQRQGKPEGWVSTGRLWGKSGDWPVVEPVEYQLTTPEFYRVRRLIRSWRIADARRVQDWGRLRSARRMLRCANPKLSAVRGVSEWIPRELSLKLYDLVTSSL